MISNSSSFGSSSSSKFCFCSHAVEWKSNKTYQMTQREKRRGDERGGETVDGGETERSGEGRGEERRI